MPESKEVLPVTGTCEKNTDAGWRAPHGSNVGKFEHHHKQ